MFTQKVETVRVGEPCQFARKLLAQTEHSKAYLFQLTHPLRFQRIIVQDHADKPRAVIRRKAVVLTVEKGEVLLRQRRFGSVLRDTHQKPSAFAVYPEILGAACRNQTLGHARRNKPCRRRIFFQPVAKALVRNIHHRDRALSVHHLNNGSELFQSQVRTRRVVAATVQQHDIACAQPVQVRHHTAKVHRACLCVKVAILHTFQPDIVQNTDVVRPCRIARKDSRLRCRHLDHFKRLPHSSSAARCRCCTNFFARHCVAQDQLDHRITIRRITHQTDIGLGFLLLPELMLCLLDRTHHRRNTQRVFVNTNTKINLVGPWISPKFGHHLHDLINRLVF